MPKHERVAIVGATGLVGIELREIMARDPALRNMSTVLFASQAAPEKQIYGLSESTERLADCSYIFNAATSEVAQFLRSKLATDQTLIDNSSAFRLENGIPLVVPEVNGELLNSLSSHVIANPNCTAALLCVALSPLKIFGLSRVLVSTYQAASGAGIRGLEQLEKETQALAKGGVFPVPEVFGYRLAGNILSHNTPIRDEASQGAGYNEEEWKVIEESRKILDLEDLPISSTCMRVPVRRAHTGSVTVDLKKKCTIEELREALNEAPGTKIVDDARHNHFPMPIEAENQDLVLVGRIRKDAYLPNTFHFIFAGDQLRKGAATNAVQILKELTKK